MYDLPQEWADLVSDQAVQHAPRLLGIDFVEIQHTRLIQRLAHCLGRDLVEENALDVVVLAGDGLGHVPSNGFALAVGVGGQVGGIGGLSCFAKTVQDLALAPNRYVARLKAVFNVDAQLFGRQIPHVPHTGFNHKIFAQNFVDCLGLGRRLDNHQ